jgi:hypothetical protein
LWKLAVGKKEYFSGGFYTIFPLYPWLYINMYWGYIYSIGPQREGSDHGVNIEEENNCYVVFQLKILGSVAKFMNLARAGKICRWAGVGGWCYFVLPHPFLTQRPNSWT